MTLDSIRLNNQYIHYVQTMGQLLAEAGLPLLTDGLILPINSPAKNPALKDTIAIDGSNLFQSIELESGFMDIVITNTLPTNLYITYNILNKISGDVIYQHPMDTIFQNTSKTKTIDLAGKEIEGVMDVQLQIGISGFPIGTKIRYADSIAIDVIIRDMKIKSAYAVFPAQNLIEHREEVHLESMGDKELTYALIKSGKMRIKAISTIEEETHFYYKIPSAKLGGNIFERYITLPKAPPGGSIEREFEYPLDGYLFDFRGENGNTVNAFYNELIGSIDSTGQKVFLTLEDSVDLIVEVVNLEPEYVKGYLGQQTFSVENDTIQFAPFTDFNLENTSLTGAKLNIRLENYLGMQGNLTINEITAINTLKNQTVQLDVSNIGTFNIEKAIETPTVQPTVSIFQLNDQNSNPSELINLFPDALSFKLAISTNTNGNNGMYNDFAYSSNLVNPYIDLTIPFAIQTDGLKLTDTVDFSSENAGNINSIKSAILKLSANNGFPLECEIAIHLGNELYAELYTLSSPEKIKPATLNATTKLVSESAISEIKFYIPDTEIEKVLLAKKAIVAITLKTKPANEHLQILSSYTINARLTGEFTLKIEK